MSRYYGHVLITFTDGTTERVGGDRERIYEGQLIVYTTTPYGGADKDAHHYPLANIREWHWEDE